MSYSLQIHSKMKIFYRRVFGYFIPIFVKEGLHSNFFSVSVLVLSCVSAAFLFADGVGQAGLAGILLASCDIIGSLVAEDKGDKGKKETRRALMDSITDVYAEIIFYTGIAVFFIQADKSYFAVFGYLCMVGSLMTVFVIMRAKSFDMDVAFGFIQRPERIAIVSVSMFFGVYGLAVGSIVVALIANYTSSRMIWKIWFTK